MLRVGVTGGSGSGKSVVSKMIADMGIPLYDVDARCKHLIREERGLRAAIVDLFGARAYFENGDYNSKFIAGVVFNDAKQKSSLEYEVGRFMMKDYEKWVEDCNKLDHPFLIVDCAYFFELHIEHMVDVFVGVNAPLAIRMERLMKRDTITAEQVNDRLRNQMDQEEKMSRCEFVFDAGDTKIDEKELGKLINQLAIFGHKYNSMERRLKKLIATGIAYGIGVGESSSEFVGNSGWNDLTMKKVDKIPDTERIMEVINTFFKDNAI